MHNEGSNTDECPQKEAVATCQNESLFVIFCDCKKLTAVTWIKGGLTDKVSVFSHFTNIVVHTARLSDRLGGCLYSHTLKTLLYTQPGCPTD